MRRFFGLVLSLFLLCSLAFVAADALGFGDAWIHERITALESTHGRALAAVVVFLLLVVDLVLPLPSSVLMTLSGALLGPVHGTLVNAAGSLACSAIGFALCRTYGARAFERLIGAGELPRVIAFVERFGPLGIVFSRSVPMLTEIVSCTAGLGRMRIGPFFAWSAIGTLPVAALYAWAGAQRATALALPLTIGVAFVVPGIALLVARRFVRT
ncbi:MAG: VTT domain-containing protein [Planctomycetes bacterium]|nr:VTT domain-containing protein [Planctomycetota bacterium]MCC7170058.1 VTT domain-containing protein [Planctomycetota bacterium]